MIGLGLLLILIGALVADSPGNIVYYAALAVVVGCGMILMRKEDKE